MFCGKVFYISDLDVVAGVDFFCVFYFVLFKSLYLLHWDKYAYDAALTRQFCALCLTAKQRYVNWQQQFAVSSLNRLDPMTGPLALFHSAADACHCGVLPDLFLAVNTRKSHKHSKEKCQGSLKKKKKKS